MHKKPTLVNKSEYTPKASTTVYKKGFSEKIVIPDISVFRL